MNTLHPLPAGQIEALAKVLGDCGSGTDISRVLATCRMPDESGLSTKWRRLEWAFNASQSKHGCANEVLAFTQAYLSPVRYANRSDDYEDHRQRVNMVLAFAGLELGPDGHLRSTETVRTLPEAEARIRTLRAKFQGRRIHPEVLRYCRVELLQDNYFHAVFEAAKGLAQRIRDLSGVEADGSALVDRVFSVERPVLAINTLRTETERSEHKGFAALLKGCFSAVRNPLAHEPKILWDGEDDAADYLTLISLLQRKLDDSVRVPSS